MCVRVTARQSNDIFGTQCKVEQYCEGFQRVCPIPQVIYWRKHPLIPFLRSWCPWPTKSIKLFRSCWRSKFALSFPIDLAVGLYRYNRAYYRTSRDQFMDMQAALVQQTGHSSLPRFHAELATTSLVSRPRSDVRRYHRRRQRLWPEGNVAFLGLRRCTVGNQFGPWLVWTHGIACSRATSPSIGDDSIGAMEAFASVLFKVLGRQYSFAPVYFLALHRLTQVCFN